MPIPDIDDFLGTPVQLSFFPGNTSQSALIPIIDDEQIEGPELFNLLLNSTDPSARISPMLSKVLIVDNEGKHCISSSCYLTVFSLFQQSAALANGLVLGLGITAAFQRHGSVMAYLTVQQELMKS